MARRRVSFTDHEGMTHAVERDSTDRCGNYQLQEAEFDSIKGEISTLLKASAKN
jgi:hypothetical protein